MADTIQIHGRSSFTAEVSFTDLTGARVDLSTKVLYFEIALGSFRKPLTASAKNPLDATLHLSVDDVDQLPTRATAFIIRDETISGDETVIGEGNVQRTGWKL